MAVESSEFASLLEQYVPRSEHEQLLNLLDELQEENKTAKGSLAKLQEEHGAATKRVQDLEGTVRGRTYKDAFREIAKAAKVKEDMIDDAYSLAGIKPDADEPDPKALQEALKGFLEKRPHYVDSGPAKPRSIPPGEGSGRGPSAPPVEGTFSVTRAQLRNGEFMKANQSKVAEAQKAGALAIVD